MGWLSKSRLSAVGLCALIALALIALSGTVLACNIPVFRFALERWRPDSIEILLFHRSGLSEAHETFIRESTPKSENPKAPSRVLWTRCDLDAPDQWERGAHQVWQDVSERAKTTGLPLAVVRSKIPNGRMFPNWVGALEQLPKATLWDSPVRQELSRRLLKGDAVVWLMMPSRDSMKTKQVRDRLQATLAALARELELPEGIGQPGSELYSEVPLLVQFSVLEWDPADQREKYLTELFLGFQSKAYQEGYPLVAPVFGRGRALEILPTDDMDEGMIRDLTAFLCGACSCQVKERNPGFDLLLGTAWDKELFGESSPAPPEEPDYQKQRPKAIPIPPGRSRR
jgi:hypothetical protein